MHVRSTNLWLTAIALSMSVSVGCQRSDSREARRTRASGQRAPTASALPAGATPAATATPTASAAADAGTLACGPNPHIAHGSFSCSTCHACAGEYGFSAISFPHGTTTEGGTLTRGSPTTCSVGCHNPFGAPPTTIAWNAGPQQCTSCHSAVPPAGQTYASAHMQGYGTVPIERAACLGCHDTSRHFSGTVRIVSPDGTIVPVDGTPGVVSGACRNCHDGSGATLAGRTPIPLLTYDSSASGDWHGARAGAGWGGTLKAPYARGQAAIACDACHDKHASTNSFLFAATVNGNAIPAGTIPRSGVGAERLCRSCHDGNRHAGCMTTGCHGADPIPDGFRCFQCHGHEGISNFPRFDNRPNHPNGSGDCVHCHEPGWSNIPYEDVPPALQLPPSVRDITATSATVDFGQNGEAGLGWVEWGIGTPGNATAMKMSSGTSNSIQITGLSESTTYVFRVAARDVWRNTARSDLYQFTTGSAHVPPAPTVHSWNVWQPWDDPIALTFSWPPTADPDGDPVEYLVQVSTVPTFATLAAQSGWIAPAQYTAQVPNCWTYFWRAKARDAAHGLESSWSTTAYVIADCSEW